MLYARVYFIWLTLNSFTDKLDREGGAPIDISIEMLDKNGFQATRNGGNSKFMAPCTYYSAVSPPTSVSSSGNSKVKHSFNSLFFCDFQICYFVSICLCICFFTSNPVGLFRSHHQMFHNEKCFLFSTAFQLVQVKAGWYLHSQEILEFGSTKSFRDGCFIWDKIWF